MGTYADWTNARAQQQGQPSRLDGPVRLTLGAAGCEQEQLMDYAPDDARLPPSHSLSRLPAQPVPMSSAGGLHSYFLLDTNVLMLPRCLEMLRQLVEILFVHNWAASTGSEPQAPRIALLVPRIVLKELDNLKSERRRGPTNKDTVRRVSEAQAANRFILGVLRRQNFPLPNGSGLPKSCWALHVQTIAHALERKESLVCTARP